MPPRLPRPEPHDLLLAFAGCAVTLVPMLLWNRRCEARRRAEAAAMARERQALEQGQSERIRALRETEAIKDQFLAIMSHELRTPINAVTGFGSILQDELVGPLNVRQQEMLGKMLDSADGLLVMVNDLLDLTQIQAGRLDLGRRPVDLAEVAEAIADCARPSADARGIGLALEIDADLPTLLADELRVGQVIAKLVSNALKFTPAGGEVRIRAYAAGDGDELVCEVHDTGPGIAEEDIARLFQRFTQLDMTSTRSAGGVGLGLYLAKALVEAHGGRIGVRSVAGCGSTFWFTLPLARVPRADAPHM